jgi:hypothetical protein
MKEVPQELNQSRSQDIFILPFHQLGMKVLLISGHPNPSFSTITIAITNSHSSLISSYYLKCCPKDSKPFCLCLLVVFKEPIHSSWFYDAR